MQNQDIFDKLMQLPLLNKLEPFYKKNKEVLLYLFFGGLTFLVSIFSFAFFHYSMGMGELIANVFSWVLAVLFAFFTNRVWVFSAPTRGAADFLRQMGSFFAGRLATLGIEELILFVFITKLRLPGMLIKVIAQIVVIVSNYFISKKLVFKEANRTD